MIRFCRRLQSVLSILTILLLLGNLIVFAWIAAEIRRISDQMAGQFGPPVIVYMPVPVPGTAEPANPEASRHEKEVTGKKENGH